MFVVMFDFLIQDFVNISFLGSNGFLLYDT